MTLMEKLDFLIFVSKIDSLLSCSRRTKQNSLVPRRPAQGGSREAKVTQGAGAGADYSSFFFRKYQIGPIAESTTRTMIIANAQGWSDAGSPTFMP